MFKNSDVFQTPSQAEQVRTPDGKMTTLAIGATIALAGCGTEAPMTAASQYLPPDMRGQSTIQELRSTWEGEGKNEIRGTIPGTRLNVSAEFQPAEKGTGGILRVYIVPSEGAPAAEEGYQPTLYIVDNARNTAFMFTRSSALEHADEKKMSHHYSTDASAPNLSVVAGDRQALSQVLKPFLDDGQLHPMRRIQMLGSANTPYTMHTLDSSAVGLKLLDTLKKAPKTAVFTYTGAENFRLQSAQ